MSGEDRAGEARPEARRRAAGELARELATDAGLRAARRQQATGTLGERLAEVRGEPGDAEGKRRAVEAAAPAAAPAAALTPSPTTPRPISIWQPRPGPPGAAGTVWERPAPTLLGDHHAARRELRAKRPGGPRRVCWFGESAAAGYLYAPHLTPAGLLEERLNLADGAADGAGRGWEVIDLARTNERLSTLAATVEAAAQLAPDVLVILSGNNWRLLEVAELSPWAPRVEARRDMAAALAAEGALGAARLARRRSAEAAALALERIAAVAAELAVPVVLLLPEVNLADWETRQPPVRLAGDGTARWHQLHRQALVALSAPDRGARAAVEAAAWRMVDLDGGTCPTPFRLLAAAATRDGDASPERKAAARDAAISEIDAVHYPLLACLAAPQAGSPERRVLELAGRRHGWHVADLRPAFAEHGGDPLPGRRLFLDYCHFTAEGMGVVAAVAAAQVLRASGRPAAERGWRELAAVPVVTPPAVEAVACLGAAVHTAHRHLPVTDRRELLSHWCRRALESDPESAAAAMLDLADARSAGLPELLSAGQVRQWRQPVRLTQQHGWRWPHLDADLLHAMTAVLVAEERPEAAQVERLLRRRALPAEGRDLVDPPHALAEPVARFLPEAMAPPGLAESATLRSPWPRTAFDVVLPQGWGEESEEGRPGAGRPGAGRPGELEVEVVARLPEGGSGRAALQLDGAPPVAFTVDGKWRRTKLHLVVGAVGRGAETGLGGVRRLTLRWPSPPPVQGDPLREAVRDLELGRETDLHPVFGEICSLRVRPL